MQKRRAPVGYFANKVVDKEPATVILSRDRNMASDNKIKDKDTRKDYRPKFKTAQKTHHRHNIMPDISWKSVVSTKTTDDDRIVTGTIADIIFPEEFEVEYAEFKRRERMWEYEKQEEDQQKNIGPMQEEKRYTTPRLTVETESESELQELRDVWMEEIKDLTSGVPP